MRLQDRPGLPVPYFAALEDSFSVCFAPLVYLYGYQGLSQPREVSGREASASSGSRAWGRNKSGRCCQLWKHVKLGEISANRGLRIPMNSLHSDLQTPRQNRDSLLQSSREWHCAVLWQSIGRRQKAPSFSISKLDCAVEGTMLPISTADVLSLATRVDHVSPTCFSLAQPSATNGR